MAVKVKDATAAAQKFVTRAGAAANDYTAGVANSGNAWQTNTQAAANTYALGVQEAISNGRFQKGVNANAQQKLMTRVAAVGGNRFSTGVQQAGPAWQAGSAPFLATIAGLTLPPRGPKGSAQNNLRVTAVTDALRAKKLSGS